MRAYQDTSSLLCDELEVILNEDNEAEQLECEGNVRIEDAEAGLSLAAAHALYDLAAETIDVFGDPITIRDALGSGADNVRALTYSFNDESMLLRSESDDVVEDGA